MVPGIRRLFFQLRHLLSCSILSVTQVSLQSSVTFLSFAIPSASHETYHDFLALASSNVIVASALSTPIFDRRCHSRFPTIDECHDFTFVTFGQSVTVDKHSECIGVCRMVIHLCGRRLKACALCSYIATSLLLAVRSPIALPGLTSRFPNHIWLYCAPFVLPRHTCPAI